MAWPIHYPDRPAIPHDTTPDAEGPNRKRSILKLAEAGYRKGRPVKQIPLYSMKKQTPPEDAA